jgi:hypothetical protein
MDLINFYGLKQILYNRNFLIINRYDSIIIKYFPMLVGAWAPNAMGMHPPLHIQSSLNVCLVLLEEKLIFSDRVS